MEGVAINEKSIVQQMQEIVEDMCHNYCKYPEIWDEDREGVERCESDICRNCPLNRLV